MRDKIKSPSTYSASVKVLVSMKDFWTFLPFNEEQFGKSGQDVTRFEPGSISRDCVQPSCSNLLSWQTNALYFRRFHDCNKHDRFRSRQKLHSSANSQDNIAAYKIFSHSSLCFGVKHTWIKTCLFIWNFIQINEENSKLHKTRNGIPRIWQEYHSLFDIIEIQESIELLTIVR